MLYQIKRGSKVIACLKAAFPAAHALQVPESFKHVGFNGHKAPVIAAKYNPVFHQVLFVG